MLYTNHTITMTKELFLNGVSVYTYVTDQPVISVFETHNSVKSSVDTGKFVPNTYRVNSYEHGREQVVSTGSGELIGWKPWASPYILKYTYKGHFGLLPYTNIHIWNRPTVDSLTDVRDLTLQKAYAKVGASMISGGENLGELKQTLEMLRSPLSSLRKFLTTDGLKNLKRLKDVLRHRKDPTKVLQHTGKTVADTWLELRYGLMPLVYSIQDLVKIYNEKAAAFDPQRVRTARSKLTTSRSDSSNVTGGSSAQLLVKAKFTVGHKIRTCSVVYFKQSSQISKSEKLGLSLQYLPETFWELTRMSFVVDWLFQVGPWLGSLRIQPDFTILGSTTSHRISSTGHFTGYDASGNEFGTPEEESLFGSASYESEWYTRYVNTGSPILPQFRKLTGLNISRLVDSLALTMQFLSKMR